MFKKNMPSEKEKYDEWRKSMATRYVEKIKEDREKRKIDPSPSPEHDRKRDKSPDRDRKDKDKSRDRKSGREYSPERDRKTDRERDRKRSPDRRRDEKESEKRFDDRDRRDRKRDDRNRGRSDRDRRDERESKRAKIEVKEETKSNGSSATGQKSKEEIEAELKMKEIMYQARMEIDERRKQWSITGGTAQPTQPSTSAKNVISLKPEEASVFIDVQMSKLNRLAELKNKLGSKLGNVPVVPAMPAVALEHMAIEKKKPEPKPEPEPEILEYLDPRVKLKPAVRQRRAFEFKEPGEYQKLANMQRNKAKLEKLQSEISQAAKHTGISSAVKLAIVTPSGAEGTTSYVPNVEWWDEVVLHGKGYDSIPSEDMNPLERFADTISELVEHPVQLKPPDEPIVPQYLRAYLTKKEQKKLRRQNRRDVLKEKAEKVRLGLEKPPEPKVKISNLMRVLGNEAIQDPTKMEAFVRKQMAERLKKHKEENEARKLSKEQKSAKKIRKIAEDTTLAVHVSVYKAKSLLHPSKKFKVEMNAKQLQMTGAIILYEDINVIVVEGGPKQQKFYKNLMLNRIKWNDEIIGQKKEAISKDTPGERNDCTLIWEGIVKRRAFHDFRFHLATSHKHAREILDKYGVAHYWDLCYSTSVLLTPEENT